MDLTALLALAILVAGAVAGAFVYLRGEVSKLRDEMDRRFDLERSTADRVYALRADLARLDARTEAIEKSVQLVLDCVRQVQESLSRH